MLDTGFDCPAVENIVMVRPTKSPILYQQMRGRGSRLCPKIGKNSFRIYDFVKNSEAFKDESYNPYSEVLALRRGVPWGTEEEELTEEEKEKREVIRRLFVQVPENAPENVDLVVKRECIEIGPEGEKVDIDDYQYQWERMVQLLLDVDSLIKKIKSGEELTDDEIQELVEKLNTPEFYFNEANLRIAYQYPQGTLTEFIKTALKIYDLPTEEQLQEKKINDLFEAWLLTKNFNAQQSKILRMIKSQYLANREKVDISIFNQPLFSQFGGLGNIIKIFGENEIQNTVQELNTAVFVNPVRNTNTTPS